MESITMPTNCETCGRPLGRERIMAEGMIFFGQAMGDLSGTWCSEECMLAAQRKAIEGAKRRAGIDG